MDLEEIKLQIWPLDGKIVETLLITLCQYHNVILSVVTQWGEVVPHGHTVR